MKKISLLSAIVASSLFATDNAKIVEYFKTQIPPEVNVEVIESKKPKELRGYEYITIRMSDETRSQDVKMFAKDGMLFPDIIDLKSQKSMRQEMELNELSAQLKAIYTKEDKANIISLGNDSKKETIVVFTDPECPYCRSQLQDIEQRLEHNNIKLLLTSVHGENALKKSFLIYKHLKHAKNDKEKIAILKKYYEKDVNITSEKITDNDIKAMNDLRNRYVGSIIKGVPYMIDENRIK